MRQLTADDIEALAVGAWILGSGGGGSPYHGLLSLRRLYRDGARIDLLDPDALDDDDDVAVVSMMGAPLVILERMVDARLIARAVEAMQEHLGRKFRAVMAIEIGGSNGMQPLLAAAHLGIPVVDADAMGRAYPGGADDSLRRRRAGAGAADLGRSARQRGDHQPSAELEVDGTRQPQALRGARLDRRHLQGAAHRRRGEALGQAAHHHAGDPPGRGRAGGAPPA